MANKRLKIDDLDQTNFQAMTSEEISSLRGGISVLELPEGRIHPDYPYPKPYPQPIQPIPCTNNPTKNGKLPWCAVVL